MRSSSNVGSKKYPPSTFKYHLRATRSLEEKGRNIPLKDANVVVGIIFNGSKFLVERRRPDEKIDPGIVCLPGGHVRENESMSDALKREMREELCIEVKDSQFVCKNFYVASNGERQAAYCFLITDYEGKPVCKSAQEVFWEDNIQNLSLEVDRQTLKRLRGPGNSLLNQSHLRKTFR